MGPAHAAEEPYALDIDHRGAPRRCAQQKAPVLAVFGWSGWSLTRAALVGAGCGKPGYGRVGPGGDLSVDAVGDCGAGGVAGATAAGLWNRVGTSASGSGAERLVGAFSGGCVRRGLRVASGFVDCAHGRWAGRDHRGAASGGVSVSCRDVAARPTVYHFLLLRACGGAGIPGRSLPSNVEVLDWVRGSFFLDADDPLDGPPLRHDRDGCLRRVGLGEESRDSKRDRATGREVLSAGDDCDGRCRIRDLRAVLLDGFGAKLPFGDGGLDQFFGSGHRALVGGFGGDVRRILPCHVVCAAGGRLATPQRWIRARGLGGVRGDTNDQPHSERGAYGVSVDPFAVLVSIRDRLRLRGQRDCEAVLSAPAERCGIGECRDRGRRTSDGSLSTSTCSGERDLRWSDRRRGDTDGAGIGEECFDGRKMGLARGDELLAGSLRGGGCVRGDRHGYGPAGFPCGLVWARKIRAGSCEVRQRDTSDGGGGDRGWTLAAGRQHGLDHRVQGPHVSGIRPPSRADRRARRGAGA